MIHWTCNQARIVSVTREALGFDLQMEVRHDILAAIVPHEFREAFGDYRGHDRAFMLGVADWHEEHGNDLLALCYRAVVRRRWKPICSYPIHNGQWAFYCVIGKPSFLDRSDLRCTLARHYGLTHATARYHWLPRAVFEELTGRKVAELNSPYVTAQESALARGSSHASLLHYTCLYSTRTLAMISLLYAMQSVDVKALNEWARAGVC